MSALSAYARSDGTRFAAYTSAIFLLMLVPSVVGIVCHFGWLPAFCHDVVMSMSISGAAVGSCALLERMVNIR